MLSDERIEDIANRCERTAAVADERGAITIGTEQTEIVRMARELLARPRRCSSG